MAQKPRGRPRLDPDKGDQNTVQALDRALALMEHIAAHPGLTLSELSEETGQAIATTFRALVTLQARGMVESQEPGQFWFIGPGAFRTGTAFIKRTNVVERARPVMDGLMRETGETASIGIEVAGQVVHLAQAESHAAIRAFFPPGTAAPMHATGAGKALLAWRDEDRARETIARQGLAKFTSLTITSDSALLRDLARTRDRGFAIDDQESADGMRCVAAPVFDAHGEPVAAIALAGPAFRMGLADATRMGARVRAAADSVTEAIGGNLP